MRISKTDAICGLSAPVARDLVRGFNKGDMRSAEVACHILSRGRDKALDILKEFEAAGFLTSETDSAGRQWWRTAMRGSALAQASLGGPIKRTTADRLLAGVIERVRIYNADPAHLLTVTRLTVFGSYLDPEMDRRGDLDLALAYEHRETDGERYIELLHDYADASERTFYTYEERLFWPFRELLMILKNRSPTVNITDQDINAFTDRFEVVYDVRDDPKGYSPRQRLTAGIYYFASISMFLCLNTSSPEFPSSNRR